MDEHEDEIKPPEAAAPAGEEPPRQEAPPSRLRRPWRWVLGAVSIAAVGAGVIFISRRGIRKPED